MNINDIREKTDSYFRRMEIQDRSVMSMYVLAASKNPSMSFNNLLLAYDQLGRVPNTLKTKISWYKDGIHVRPDSVPIYQWVRNKDAEDPDVPKWLILPKYDITQTDAKMPQEEYSLSDVTGTLINLSGCEIEQDNAMPNACAVFKGNTLRINPHNGTDIDVCFEIISELLKVRFPRDNHRIMAAMFAYRYAGAGDIVNREVDYLANGRMVTDAHLTYQARQFEKINLELIKELSPSPEKAKAEETIDP